MKVIFAFFLWLMTLQIASAIDCVWLANPTSNDWDTAANWSSGTVPGYEDSVFFAQSDQTKVSVRNASDAYTLTFEKGADAYEIDVEPTGSMYIGFGMNFRVTGIHNLSGVMQNFVLKSDDSGNAAYIYLYGNAGHLSTFTMEPARIAGGYSGYLAVYVDDGQIGRTVAGTSVFINQGGIVAGGQGGVLDFDNGGSAGHATIINQAATDSGAIGGLTTFERNSGPDKSTITNEGAQIAGAAGGMTRLSSSGSRQSSATLIAEGGGNGGGGGTIQFYTKSGSGIQIKVFGNGTLDLVTKNLTTGSLEGDGQVLLEGHRLRLGDNDLSTTFSGVIQGDGEIAKIGMGTLTLDGVNTYTTGTTINQGALIANTQEGSATGSGPVTVNAGSLGGTGIIAGPVTIGQGHGGGAFLTPSLASTGVARLQTQQSLSFRPDGSYLCKIDGANVQSDQVRANAVTIGRGAQFGLEPTSDQKLTDGTVFVVIDNVSAQPIAGSFANLPKGSVITVGQNSFRGSYEGGDGNDLTLTVVP